MKTITITVRRPVRDRYGDLTDAAEHTIGGWVFVPTASDEEQHHSDQVTRRITGYGPPDADVRATDQVVLPGGQRWEVAGAPLHYTDPFPTHDLSNTVLYLERVTG